MGWDKAEEELVKVGRRERFKSELDNLNSMQRAEVVVEASFMTCLENPPEQSNKSKDALKKIFFQSVVSFRHHWPHVAWTFCDSRWMAEEYVFRSLEKFYDEKMDEPI